MITSPLPPDVKPWANDMEKRVTSLERAQQQVLSGSTRSQNLVAVTDGVINAPSGVTAEFIRLGTGVTAPLVQVVTGGVVVITLTAHIRGIWNGTGDAVAVGSMTFLVDGKVPGGPTADRAEWGIHELIQYRSGQTNHGLGRTVSVTRAVAVSHGAHTFSADYLYHQLTSNITVQWSRRSITVETR